jgi:predicted transcriptional regulator
MESKKNILIDTKIIDEFEALQNDLEKVIKELRFTKQFIIRASEIPRTTFFIKLANKSFSTDELRKIATIINENA